MDTKLFKDRMVKFEGVCKQLDALPEVLFARGMVGGRPAPRLNLQSLKELKENINEVLDAKERQLKGIDDPYILNVSF